MTEYFSEHVDVDGYRIRSRVRTKLQKLAATISLLSSRRRQLHALLDLDDRLLRDVGLTRSQVLETVNNPHRFGKSKRSKRVRQNRPKRN